MTVFKPVENGQLAYEVAGDGTPVVFVHGFTLDMRMWDDQFDEIAKAHRVVRYDLRGFGQSSPPIPSVGYTHASDLLALLDELRIERPVIVALSLGGWVALEFALTYPDRVGALVFVDSALRGYDGWSAEFNSGMDEVYRVGREVGVQEAIDLWLGDPIFAHSRSIPLVKERLSQIVGDYPGWHFLNDDPHLGFDIAPPKRLGEIAVPTLVIVGEHDSADFRGIADVLANGISGAKKAVLPGAGHMANMDDPTAFNSAVLGFLAEVGELTAPRA